MNAHGKCLTLLLLLNVLTGIGVPSTTQTTAPSQIKAEISRLQQSLKDTPIADKNFAEVPSMVEGTLKAATEEVNAGQLYLALEKLGQAESLLHGARRASAKGEVEKGGLPAFESQWKTVSLRLNTADKDAHAKQWNHAPLAVRALSEAAQGKAIPLLEGAQGFAVATGPKDGLFYIGQAEGESDFGTFCASLSLVDKGAAFPLRSWLPELQNMQAKANAAFQPPQSIDLHSRFIALNSTIKLAQELDASRFYAGALLSYLEAVRHYGMLKAPPLDAAKQAQLKQDLAAERTKLAVSSGDDSLAQLFMERAQSYAVHPDGSAPTADEWRGARVILDQVLPAYYAAKKPAAQIAQAPGKTVEITLVRWPYT
jgi:hypothetical protein